MSGFKQILSHSRNYLIANLATKALAFISIPVYTRLLSTDEYGVFSIFIGVAGILSSLMAFSLDRSISRYYFDKKSNDDFKMFNGTSIIISVFAFFLSSLLLFLFANQFGGLVNLEKGVVYLLIPFTLINIVGLTFEQIYGPQKKSEIIAKSSISRVIIGFLLSVILLLIFDHKKYYGLLYGQIIAGFILSVYWLKKIIPYIKLKFKVEYLKYIFTYSVPLIPYALSGEIIAQFGKIAIGNQQGLSHAGFYTIAQQIGGLVLVIISVTHQAWNPYYMEYMNTKNYIQLDKDFIRIFKVTVLFAFIIGAFGREVGLILAKSDFSSSFYLIPIFSIGYIFYQLSYTYLRNFGYSKHTYFMTITVLISGISNVVLNVFLIPHLGDLGAALSFMISYFIMATTGWVFNRFFVKLHVTSLKKLLFPLLLSTPFFLILFFLSFIDAMFLILLFVKIVLVLLLFYVIMYNEKDILKNILKSLFRPIK